jgi:diguanylate cyclase (GGDEF)-like protein
MKASKKIIILSISGIIIGLFIFIANYLINQYIKLNRDIFYDLNTLQKEEYKLHYHLLQSSLYMYYNNDYIANDIKIIEKKIKELKESRFFRSHFKRAYNDLLIYEKLFNKKVDLIFEYQKYNLPLKNSIIYLADILKKLPYEIKNREYLKSAINIISSIFLARQTIDLSFLKDISFELDKIRKIYLTPQEEKINEIFLNNLYVFFKDFPKYKMLLNKIISLNTSAVLNGVFLDYDIKTKEDIKIFNFLSYFMALFIVGLIIYLIYSLFKLESKIKEITYLLYHDTLTKLYNRNKFNVDVGKFKKPALILFNIDKFKHINDIFGTSVGDDLLKSLANNLLTFMRQKDKNALVYRLGADDFGVLLENYSDKELKKIAKEFIEFMEGINIKLDKNVIYNLSLSAGISKQKPLLETADVALKKVKTDFRHKIQIFVKDLNEQIKENIKKTNELKYAIENDKIIPYFQGIYDKDKNLIKYEVLARIETPNGEIKSIFPYLKIAMENRQYNYITLAILKKLKNVLKHHSDIKLSINLSIHDITHKDTKEYILKEFLNENVRGRITFEVLESEIKNYEIIKKFIDSVKFYDVDIAIDDFGSGYSNFSRILSLDVDYLKIDGSLIKNIYKDKNSKLIVETIVNFAKKTRRKTIAEFVSSKEIFDICKNIGVDYFQGFYLDEPTPKFN